MNILNILKRSKRGVLTVALTLIFTLLVPLLDAVILPAISLSMLDMLSTHQLNMYYGSIYTQCTGFNERYINILIERSPQSVEDIKTVYNPSEISNTVYNQSLRLNNILDTDYVNRVNERFVYTVLKSESTSKELNWYHYMIFEEANGTDPHYSYTGFTLCVPPILHSRAETENRIEELYKNIINKEWHTKSEMWYQVALGYDESNAFFGAPYTSVTNSYTGDNFLQYHLLSDGVLFMTVNPNGNMINYKIIEDSEFFPYGGENIISLIAQIRKNHTKLN